MNHEDERNYAEEADNRKFMQEENEAELLDERRASKSLPPVGSIFMTDDPREIEWRQYVGKIEEMALFHSRFSDGVLADLMRGSFEWVHYTNHPEDDEVVDNREDIILTLQEAGWTFEKVIEKIGEAA